MGNTNSNNPEYKHALTFFNAHEREQLKELFEKLCQSSEGLVKDKLHILTAPYIPANVSDNLHNYMILKDESGSKNDLVTGEGFVIALSHALKGSLDEKAAVFYCMACGNITEPASLDQICNVVTSLFDGYRTHIEQYEEFATWGFKHSDLTDSSGLLTKALVHELVSSDKLQCEIDCPDVSTVYSIDQVQSWLGRSSLLFTLFDTVLQLCFPIHFVGAVGTQKIAKFPVCKGANWDSMTSLLNLPSLIYLNSRVPHDLRQQWTLLYSSKTHGESFSTFYGKIMSKGPTIMIIRDTKGHVFGGFASESWTPTAKFIGSTNCFLFNLKPHVAAYYSTGLNNNFMYFNHSQETLPNGLGMGGQFDYFGLWLDQEFTKGHSKAQPRSTTYDSPQLSADTEFTVDVIEVWKIGPDPKKLQTTEDEAVQGSILDKDPGAKAILSLIDKGHHSEGLREADATADIPEQHQLHPTMDTS